MKLFIQHQKDLVIIENFEASDGWFPIKWNPQKPQVLIGNHKMNLACLPCCDEYYTANTKHKIDYIAVFGKLKLNAKDSCQNTALKIIFSDYNLIYKSDDNFVELYKIKDKVNSN